MNPMRIQFSPVLQKLSNLLIPAGALAIVLIWLSITPPDILSKFDAIGYAVCHRLDERSFHYGSGTQLPLCARCSGMYLAAVVGLAFQVIFSRRKAGMPPKKIIIPLLVLGLAFAVDGVNSYFYLMKSMSPGRFDFIPILYIPNNILRLLTGSGAGLGLAVALFPAFNQTIWRDWDPAPAMGSLKHLGILLALMLGLDLLVLTDLDVVLYPVAILSAMGVLLLLTMVYAVLWVAFTRQDNSFTAFRQIWLPVLGGLTVALLQITVIDLFRLWFTHTWGGFPLPLG
jgi:uncharacterized membrane protein